MPLQMTRDAKGRFNGTEWDPETVAKIAKENAQAEKIIKALGFIGVKPDSLGIKQWPETGNWYIPYTAKEWIAGLLFGLSYAQLLDEGTKSGSAIFLLYEVAGGPEMAEKVRFILKDKGIELDALPGESASA